jgi:hypothetical protein
MDGYEIMDLYRQSNREPALSPGVPGEREKFVPTQTALGDAQGLFVFVPT